MMCPPILIYTYERIPSEITQIVPDGWSTTITYKMFEETVGSQLIIELKIREKKKEAEHAFKRRIDTLEENIIRRARTSR
jgi:hypothetical protein